MAYFLFIDESGHDRRESPYEVLAGVCVKASDLWSLILALRETEVRCFGTRYTAGQAELKAKKLLKTKVFRHAALLPPLPPEERCELARRCIENGAGAGMREWAALAQAKIAYVREALEICAHFRCRAFASIVNPSSPVPPGREHLRKDYAYLFERFFYFLEDTCPRDVGVVVFDELERVQSHILTEQMGSYFLHSATGRHRAMRILPEPLFVHSELTTGVQLADLVAYIVSWGFRTNGMTEPARPELAPLVERVRPLRHYAVREKMGNPRFRIWSFAVIDDLRARDDLRAKEGANSGR
jgi:Protein of unknown function (DUF3800)